jgi:DNA invertase Pin-like site-specific DNA recombinase
VSPRLVSIATLPPDLDHIRGMRVARWLRESTPGQMDYFGPAAQTRLIDEALARHGLRDTGIGWTVAASGWKRAWLTPEWQEMLTAAREGRFDLLLVAYQSRFLRNVKQTLIAIEDHLHPAGVAVFFIDERLLSSDPDHWHAIVEEATDAERYSRRMAKRQREGHAAKRGVGEPGGRPPFGFRREQRDGKPPVLAEIPERIELVRAMFRWAAEGLADREIAARAGLVKAHVAEVLTNPIFNGVLRDGNRRPAIIDDLLWTQVQEMRSRHSHRHPGPAAYRSYLWSALLQCRACSRRLIGHGGRYRHTDACEDFRRARPGHADRRGLGDSYKAEVYDDIALRALAHVVANSALIAEVEDCIEDRVAHLPDQFRLARIRRERQQATRRLEADRDAAAWKATWDRLDREEAAAATVEAPSVTAREIAESLADLQTLFVDAEPATRHRIVQALFERVEVLGPSEIWLHPSIEAETRGWATAMSGEFRMELRQTGRGERI